MKTIEMPVENFHRLSTEMLYYKYYKSNREQVKGIDRKNRQIAVLRERLGAYEKLKRVVKRHTMGDMSDEHVVDLLTSALRFWSEFHASKS